MELISEELVERTWKEASDIEPRQANIEIQTIGLAQPDLLAFLIASTEDLSSDAQELAIYLFFVVYRMFHSAGKKIRKVTSDEIKGCYEKNQSLLNELESKGALLDEIATFQVLHQPYVMKYISEALLEEEEDYSGLSEEENRILFLLLKTAVDALDRAT